MAGVKDLSFGKSMNGLQNFSWSGTLTGNKIVTNDIDILVKGTTPNLTGASAGNEIANKDYADSAHTGKYLKLDGSTEMTGDIDCGNQDILDCKDIQLKGVTYQFPSSIGTANQVLTIDTVASPNTLKWSAVTATGSLLVDGSNNMEANLDMTNGATAYKIVNLADPTADQDAVTKKYYTDNLPPDQDLSPYFKKDGSVTATGDFDLGSNKITSLADPTADQDAVTKKYYTDNLPPDQDLSPYFKKDGSVAATGDFDLGTKKITGLGDPTADQDAVTKKYYTDNLPPDQDLSPYFKKDGSVAATGDFDLGTKKITGLGDPTADQDAVTKKYYTDNLPAAPDLSPYFKKDGSVAATGDFNLSGNDINNIGSVSQYSLPDNYGFAGRFLKTNADGTTEWAAGAGGGSLWTTGAGTIIYYNSGLVGINKTTPVARLHVKGTGDYNSSEPIILTEDTRSSGTPRSTSYVSMGINGRYDYNGEAGLELNRGGYQNGYTQFRNVYFFDGKNALKGTFTGQTGNLNIDGLLTAGVGQVGTWSANTDFAFFGYSSNNTTGNYAMIQQSTGYLYINRPTGKSINFRENNGVSQVFIKSGGNVGIGTVDPNERLVVTAEATATLKHMRLHNTAQWYGPRLYFSNSTLGNTNENCYIGISDTAFNINATHANSYIRFNTAVSDSMRIMNDGNIGISNTAPPERLTIGGTGNILIKSGYLEYIGHPTLISGYEGFRLWRSSSICYFDTGSNGTVFRNWDGAGTGYTQMTLRADGNILTSPSITSASNNRSKGLYFWSDLGFGCEMTYLDSSWASTFHGRTSDYWWFRLGGYPSNASAQSQFVSVAQGGAYSQFVTMAQPYLACSCHTASDGSMTHVTNLNGSSSKPSGMITGQYRYYLLPVGIRPNTSGNYIVNVSFFGATDGSTNPRTANINQQSTYFDVWVRNHNATRVDHAHMITVTFFAGNP